MSRLACSSMTSGGMRKLTTIKSPIANADWSASSLLKSEYIKGIDNQPLQPESNSYGTLQGYSHYRLTFPNELTKITLSGNYMLSITDSYGTELFSRRFVLYTPQVNVLTEVKRARDLQYFDTQQVVQFTIRQKDFRLDNPQCSSESSYPAKLPLGYGYHGRKTSVCNG